MCPNWPICVSKLLILCTWQKKNLIFMCALSAIYIGEVKHTLMGGANELTGAHPFFLWSWGVCFPLFSYLQDLLLQTASFGIPLLLCFLIGLECGTLLLVQMFLILFLAYLILRKLMYLILAPLCMLYAQFEALF